MTNDKESSVQRRHRSPAYPYLDLKSALEKVQAFYDKERLHKAPVRSALEHMGYTAGSSAGYRALSSALQFGILEEEGAKDNREVWLSALGKAILLDRREESAEREDALKRAALMPGLHHELWDLWRDQGGFPSDSTIETKLIKDMDFNPASAPDFIKELKATFEFASVWKAATATEEPTDDSVNSVRGGPTAGINSGSNLNTAKNIMPAGTRDLTIPLIGGQMAILRVATPLTKKNYDLLLKWFEIMREALVEPESDGQVDPIS
jgi:hypothetical protein